MVVSSSPVSARYTCTTKPLPLTAGPAVNEPPKLVGTPVMARLKLVLTALLPVTVASATLTATLYWLLAL